MESISPETEKCPTYLGCEFNITANQKHRVLAFSQLKNY
jgi:hypothetical protein